MFKAVLLVAAGLATALVAGEVSGRWVGTIESANIAANPCRSRLSGAQRNGKSIPGTVYGIRVKASALDTSNIVRPENLSELTRLGSTPRWHIVDSEHHRTSE
jgi:hypothetical protein